MRKLAVVLVLALLSAVPAAGQVLNRVRAPDRLFIAVTGTPEVNDSGDQLYVVFDGLVRFSRSAAEMPSIIYCSAEVAAKCFELEPEHGDVPADKFRVARGHWDMLKPADDGTLRFVIDSFHPLN